MSLSFRYSLFIALGHGFGDFVSINGGIGEMTLIKSHTCTKCGGQLIVHNDRQQYECPYCSVFYDYAYFRARDILDQADSSLKVLQYDSAREKYSFLLQKEPHNFRALTGKFLCDAKINRVKELGKIENFARIKPSSVNEAEEMALPEDKPFFSKLRIMKEYEKTYSKNKTEIDIVEKYNEQKRKMMQELHASVFVGQVEDPSDDFGNKLLGGCLLAASAVFLILAFSVKGDAPVFMCVFFSLACLAYGLLKITDFRAKKEVYDRTREDLEMKYHLDTLGTGKPVTIDENAGEELKAKNSTIRAEFSKLYRELVKLQPKPETGSSDASKSDPIQVNLKKTPSCTKCAGELIVNVDRQVYECPFCGVSFDFDFIRDETALEEAGEAIEQAQFVKADGIYKYVLTVDPKNFEALFGRILCAAKWTGIEIASKNAELYMRKAHVPTMKIRIEEALSHCSDEDRPCFEKLGKIFPEYEKYVTQTSPAKPARRDQERLLATKEDLQDEIDVLQVEYAKYMKNYHRERNKSPLAAAENAYITAQVSDIKNEMQELKHSRELLDKRLDDNAEEIAKLSAEGGNAIRNIEKLLREISRFASEKTSRK